MKDRRRAISLDAIREAAEAVYGSFKIRGAANVIRQLSRDELARRRVDGRRRQGGFGRGLHGAADGRAVLRHGDRHRPAKVDAIDRLGATIVRATYDECWQTVCAFEPHTAVCGAEPETAAPLHTSLAAGRPVYFENWRAPFVDGAGGKSVLETMWPLLQGVRGSVVVTLDEVPRAIRLAAERAHVIAEGAAGCAVAAALSGGAGAGKVVAVVSGGNIDLARFAQITGAHNPTT